jgi:hypothetical protein
MLFVVVSVAVVLPLLECFTPQEYVPWAAKGEVDGPSADAEFPE